MDNTVKKKLSVFRKRQTVFVIIYGLINAVVIAGIIVYYRLKEQVLAGALYLQDTDYIMLAENEKQRKKNLSFIRGQSS